MATTRTWAEPTLRTCPEGHPAWQCIEVMALVDLAVQRRGLACRTCDWDDFPPFVEGTHNDRAASGR
jgi:hypothetical protein